MNAQQHIEEAFHCIKAKTLIIRLESESPDPDALVKFLRHKLSYYNARLHIGRQYTIQYTVPIRFTLVDGTPNFQSLEKMGFIVHDMGYIVSKHTKIRLEQHFNIQPVELLIGYGSELQPLQMTLSKYFMEESDDNFCKQLAEIIADDLVSRFNELQLRNTEDALLSNQTDLSEEKKEFSEDINTANNHSNFSEDPNETGSGIGDPVIDKMVEGFVIFCPEGCGKSTIIKRLAANYPSVVFSKSKDLNSLIQLANAKKPCLFLIDDLDQIKNPKSLASALDSLNGVLVVGTASSVAGVFPGLRKPGRLSAVVTLGKPTAEIRRDVLHSVNGNLSEQEDSDYSKIMEEIVTATHGCFTREVLQLLMSARMCEKEDVLTMIGNYRPSKEVGMSLDPNSAEKTKSQIKSVEKIHVVGYSSILKDIEEKFDFSLNHASVFLSMNLPLPSKMLLFGPSGCGKTHLVRHFARKFSLPLRSVTRVDVFGKYFGESEKNLNAIFDSALNTVPSILFFPSFEGLASVRNEGHHDVEGRVVNLLKARLDGALRLEGLFVIAETSRPELLDSNIIRAGRFTSYVHVDLPSDEDRKEALRYFLRDFTGDVDEESLCDNTEGCTIAEIKSICQEMELGSPLPTIRKAVTQRELAKLKAFAIRVQQH